MGKVRIEPFPGHIVDIFVTHTCASDDNSYYRQKQVIVLHRHPQTTSLTASVLCR